MKQSGISKFLSSWDGYMKNKQESKNKKRLQIAKLIIKKYKLSKDMKELILSFYPFDFRQRKELSQWLTYDKNRTRKGNKVKHLDDEINLKIDKNIKELLELINKNSENELIERSLKIETISTLDDGNILNTEYKITFNTVLTKKEIKKAIESL